MVAKETEAVTMEMLSLSTIPSHMREGIDWKSPRSIDPSKHFTMEQGSAHEIPEMGEAHQPVCQ